MNEDGFADLILPPQRGRRRAPPIFLGDGKGGWKNWTIEVARAFNYGSVVAADFNKDSNMDLAFGIHLSGVAVFLGDGKGNFTEVSSGLARIIRREACRRRRRRRRLDRHRGHQRRPGHARQGARTPARDAARLPQPQAGEELGADEHRRSETARRRRLAGRGRLQRRPLSRLRRLERLPERRRHHLPQQGPKQYEVVPGGNEVVPFLSFYWANTVGRFSSRDHDDAIVTSTRRWAAERRSEASAPRPPIEAVVTVDRISFETARPSGRPSPAWGGPSATNVTGRQPSATSTATARTTYLRPDGMRGFVILLGDGKGGFRQVTVDGLDLAAQRHYDCRWRT